MRRRLFIPLVLLVAYLATGCGTPPKPRPPRWNQAESLVEKGREAFRQGCIRKAEAYFRAALELHRSMDARRREARDLSNLAVLLASRSRYTEALSLLARAERINRAEGASKALFSNLLNRARIYLKLEKWAEARRILEEARALPDVDKTALASWNALHGLWYLEQDRTADAAEIFEKALRLADPDKSPRTAAELHHYLARAYRKTGPVSRAIQEAEQALALDKAAAYIPGVGEDLALLGALSQAAGASSRAADFYERAFYVFYYRGQHRRAQELVGKLQDLGATETLKRLEPYLGKGGGTEGLPSCP